MKVEFDPRHTSSSNRPDSGEIGEDDRYFWDYCTPAPVENIGEEDGQGVIDAETLPEWEGGGKTGSFQLTGSKLTTTHHFNFCFLPIRQI